MCSIPGAAEGPLAGRTVGVKDNVCVAGIPLLNGSPIMEGYVPREDATVVTRLLDAGATIVGKTAVPAFCFDGGGLTGYPEPQPTNPHDPAYMCGSSSNGSAAVVVTGQADMALGGDQGGSIRLPASWSGCCGHKPTLRPGALHGHLPDRADDRPHRPDGAHGGRLRASCSTRSPARTGSTRGRSA